MLVCPQKNTSTILQWFFTWNWLTALPTNLAQKVQCLCTNHLFTYLPLNCFFKTAWYGSELKNMPVTLACVRLKKEIINIALEAGCELITALGTHQHTCSTVLCCYTFPEVEMSSFTVITFLPPLTIDYLHFSISSRAVEMAHMALYRYSTDQAWAEVATS